MTVAVAALSCDARPPAPSEAGCLPATVFVPQTWHLYQESEGKPMQNYTVIPPVSLYLRKVSPDFQSYKAQAASNLFRT